MLGGGWPTFSHQKIKLKYFSILGNLSFRWGNLKRQMFHLLALYNALHMYKEAGQNLKIHILNNSINKNGC